MKNDTVEELGKEKKVRTVEHKERNVTIQPNRTAAVLIADQNLAPREIHAIQSDGAKVEDAIVDRHQMTSATNGRRVAAAVKIGVLAKEEEIREVVKSRPNPEVGAEVDTRRILGTKS